MNRSFKLAALAASVALLVACGGDGGDDPAPAPTQPTAEGAYSGTLSSGSRFSAVVLEDGTFFSLYGPLVNNVWYLAGMLQGNGTSKDGAFTSANAIDFPAQAAPIPATVDARYVAGVSLDGTITEAGQKLTFTATASADKAAYDYNAPATLAAIEGVWTLTTLDGAPVAATVKSGALQATSNGCNLSGSIQPRASGKNVYDVALTFGPAPCQLAGQQLRGNAIVGHPGGGSQQQIIVTGVNANRTASITALGTR